MERDSDDEVLEGYRRAIADAWKHNGDSNAWPIKLNAAMHLFVPEFGEELIDDLAWLERKYALAVIAKPFKRPSQLFRLIDSVIYSMRRHRYSIRQQRQIVLKLLEMARSLKHGSEFNEGGCNIVLDEHGAASIAATLRSEPVGSRADADFVHRFCGLMWAYTEALMFRAHDLCKEFHGPYTVGGRQFIVKQYMNLCPRELWPSMPMLPCDSISVALQYDHSVRLAIDPLSHIKHQGGRLVDGLDAYTIEIDGVPHGVERLASFIPTMNDTIRTISRYMEGTSWNVRVEKYAEVFWFRKRPLAEQRGRDWRVPARVREAIQKGSEDEHRRAPLSSEASQRLAMLTI